MDDDLTKPVVCVCNKEVIEAITDWGRKAISAKLALDKVVALLECLFRDRYHMVNHKNELKFYLRSSLADDRQAILSATDEFLNKKAKTEEEKAQMGERRKIGKTLNKLYLDLLNATFPLDDDAPLLHLLGKHSRDSREGDHPPTNPPTGSRGGEIAVEGEGEGEGKDGKESSDEESSDEESDMDDEVNSLTHSLTNLQG